MKYPEEKKQLKDGRICVLRSPESEKAEEMLSYLRKVSEETHFMTRYPEEVMTDIEEERTKLKEMAGDENPGMMITAVVDGKIVGSTGIFPVQTQYKLAHRMSLGIAVLKEYWGCGIGTILLQVALEQAKVQGFYQVELGVYEDNTKARAMYQKAGFEEWGCIKNAFRLKDGTMINEIAMGKVL